jgi:pentatricopeptide repeat protein
LFAKAREVLEQLPLRSTVAWNALISGYAEQGRGEEALISLFQMQDEGIRPNDATFLCVLSACSHSGLVDEAEDVCVSMTSRYGITPSPDHFTCMIVGFGSIGRFDQAVRVVSRMPVSDRAAVWLPLLAACRKWGYVRLGMLAFDQVMQLDASCGAAYVLMANIFATCGMQEDAEIVESLRRRYVHGCDALQSSAGHGGLAWIDAGCS